MNRWMSWQTNDCAAQVQPLDDGRWELTWTNYVADTRTEEYDDQSTALLRLAALVACAEADWELELRDVEDFERRARAFVTSETRSALELDGAVELVEADLLDSGESFASRRELAEHVRNVATLAFPAPVGATTFEPSGDAQLDAAYRRVLEAGDDEVAALT